MSAFILNAYHLSVLGRAASAAYGDTYGKGVLTWYNEEEAREYAQKLYKENVRSVTHRYHEPASNYERNVRFDRRALTGVLKPVQVIKAALCCRYQSCETDDYRKTEAAKIIEDIISAFAGALPGYDNAQWEIEYPEDKEETEQ